MSFLLPKILQYALSSTGIGRVAYLVITSLQPPDPQGCKLNIFRHVCIHSLSHLNLLFLDFNINNDTFFWLSYTNIHLCHQRCYLEIAIGYEGFYFNLNNGCSSFNPKIQRKIKMKYILIEVLVCVPYRLLDSVCRMDCQILCSLNES